MRPLKASELDEMRRVWKEAGLPYRPRGRDSLQNLEKQRRLVPGYFIGAFQDSRLIGVSLVTDDGRKGWINRLAVNLDSRRQGVASLLIRRSEEMLRRRGIHLLCAHIELGNKESFSLFENAGYRVEKEIAYLTKRDRASY